MTVDSRIEFIGTTVKSLDAVRVAKRLDSLHIHVRGTVASATLLLSIVNLLARIFPNITIEAPRKCIAVPFFGNGEISELAKALVHNLRPSAPIAPSRTIVIDTGTGRDGADIYVTADTWTLGLSRTPLDHMEGSGPAQTAAAALAASEVFREALPEFPGVRLRDRPFFWNLLDYRTTQASEPFPVSAVDAICFGAGSVGSSILYALVLGNASGSLIFVDPDHLSPRNRFRYPLWLATKTEPKVTWIQRIASGTQIRVQAYAESAADFIYRYKHPIAVAIAAVDNLPARRDITDALAHTTLNAGVDGMKFHVSRHHFDDGYSCAYCQYVNVGEAMDEVAMYVQLTGLEAGRVLQLLSGEQLQPVDLQCMVQSGKLPYNKASRDLVGGRLQDALRLRLYEQASIPVTSGALAIAAPFVSALAGSVLAAELQKLGTQRPDLFVNRRIDIDCSGFPTGFQSQPLQDPLGRCLCHNDFRRRQYKAIWSR
jgi:hypothetical protein